MPKVQKCCVVQCPFQYQDSILRRFPSRYMNIIKVWAERTGNPKLVQLANSHMDDVHKLVIKYQICEFHFASECVIDDPMGRREPRLVEGAVPTLYLPVHISPDMAAMPVFRVTVEVPDLNKITCKGVRILKPRTPKTEPDNIEQASGNDCDPSHSSESVQTSITENIDNVDNQYNNLDITKDNIEIKIISKKNDRNKSKNPKMQMRRDQKRINELKQATVLTTAPRDEFTLYGEYIASKIRSLDEHSQIVLQHQFNNILFEVEMENEKCDTDANDANVSDAEVETVIDSSSESCDFSFSHQNNVHTYG